MDLYLFLLILIIPICAQIYINVTYKKYKNILNKKSTDGREVAQNILDKNKLSNIYIVEIKQTLADHYDSSRKVIRLSSDIYNNPSISSVAVSAHECGHAIQDKENYFFYKLRSFIFPIVKFGTSISYVVIMIGLFAELLDIVYIGIALISLGLIFQLVTLPVEIDASKRALKELEKLKVLDHEELKGAKKMLTAAAMTYVAGILTSLLEILRLIMIFGDNKN